MSKPDNLGGNFPERVFALLSGARDSSAPVVTVPEIREPTSEIRQPVRRPRGVSIGAVATLMLVSMGFGAAAWENYGEELRSKLGIGRHEKLLATAFSTALPPATGTAHDEALDGLVRNLQEAQKRTADRLEAILQSQASQQAIEKTTSDTLAVLAGKVDTLRPPVPTVLVTKPAPVLPRTKQLSRSKPPVVSQAPVDPTETTPRGAPLSLRP